jgi:hypothetical protein
MCCLYYKNVSFISYAALGFGRRIPVKIMFVKTRPVDSTNWTKSWPVCPLIQQQFTVHLNHIKLDWTSLNPCWFNSFLIYKIFFFIYYWSHSTVAQSIELWSITLISLISDSLATLIKTSISLIGFYLILTIK